MWISETDQEVKVFHPVCAQALESALEMVGLSDNYCVEHHRYVGSLEMDLVISNKTTKKILCVVEVKRTIPAVYSSRYQYQAMSYVQSLRDSEKESNYYILTNLECSCLFKYSSNRPNVYDQLLLPGISMCHRFEDVSEDVFRRDLALQYREYLMKIIEKNADYVLSFSQFAEAVQDCMPNLIKWNTSLAFLFYEYIRGSFATLGRSELYDIRRFRSDIVAICREASRVNFEGIFGLPREEYGNQYSPSNSLIGELYKLGKNFKDAEAICNIMHQVISNGHTHEGEVPTDIELAQAMSALVHWYHPTLKSAEQLCDPAAGSGTLLSAVISKYNGIQPVQIKANDINRKLLQLLTLRMGLNFAGIINKENFPKISTKDIALLGKTYFEKTSIIVMNPPYLSAVSEGCSNRKQSLVSRIQQITGKRSKTNLGQAPLECPFLELVTNMANENTLIACILPNTHLTALGEADIAFRKFLIEDFGLSMIFTYPQSNLFEDVAQNTSIFIGFARRKQDKIRILQSMSIISEIDESRISTSIDAMVESNIAIDLEDGLSGFIVDSKVLLSHVDDGWAFIDPVKAEALQFFTHKILKTNYFTQVPFSSCRNRYRGKVGNSGGNDLLFISTNEAFYNAVKDIVSSHIDAGLRNADYKNFEIGEGDTVFLNVSNMSDKQIQDVVEIYKKLYEKTEGKQKRTSKSINDYVEILKRESNFFVPANTVILSRASRKFASVYVSDRKTYLSTNFFAIETSSRDEAVILASWMSSIFFQLHLEIVSKNQGGMRKIEAENIDRTFVPNIDKLSKEDKDLLLSTTVSEFFDLKKTKIRDIDRAWAKVIAPGKESDLLEEALRYITMMAVSREY